MNKSEEFTVSIRAAGNTLVPCLQTIAAKGYAIKHYFLGESPDDWDRPQWDAERDGCHFSATSPEELLGLITMWEVRGSDWHIKDGEDQLYDQLIDSSPIYDRDGNIIDT